MKKTSVILFLFSFILASALGQDNLNTTRIGVWPYGPSYVVALHNENIFLGYGRSVQIYEYANPEQPQLLGEVFLDDMITAMAFDNDKAFVAGYTGFFILDISNTAQPAIISSFDLESRANAICLSNGYAYLAFDDPGILILDISDLQNPTMAAFYQTDGVNYEMVIQNNVAWVASGYSGLTAYDLSDPVSPVPFFNYVNSGGMRGVTISGSLLYIANSFSGIMVFDISSLPQVELLSSTPTFSAGSYLDIEGNLLAVSMLNQGFCLYDISEPAAPDSLGWFYADWANRNTVLKNGLAFHCNLFDFYIVDISNPQQMNLKANIELSDISQYAYYWENHLYIDATSRSIMAVDVTDPEQAVKVAQIDGGVGHYTIHVKDDLLFTNNFHWLKVYDVSVPSEPVYLNTLEASTTINCVLKDNNLLFVSDYDSLQVFNIADIFNPVLMGVYPFAGIQEMTSKNQYLYCVKSSDFLIIDFSDPTNLQLLSSTYEMMITSMAVKDTLAYVVSSNYSSIGERSLKVFNIKDPSSVFLETSRDPGREFEHVVLEGDYLYVFESNAGLQIYDIREIYPVYCGFYSFDLTTLKTAVANGISYFPVFAGLDIVRNDLITSAENIFIGRDERLNLFPNPAGNNINLGLEPENPSGMFTWEIVQMNGTATKSGKLMPGQRQISLDGLPAGVYVLKILLAGEKYKSGLFVRQ